MHPTQIYESAASFAIAALLILVLRGRKRYDGQVFLAFIALYAAARFVIEFWREDDRGGLYLVHGHLAGTPSSAAPFADFGLSTSQLIGVALVMGAVWLHRRLVAARPAV